jgi:SAM-dependent methyltransferase
MIEIRHKAVHDGATIRNAYDSFYQDHSLRMRDSFYLWLLELIQPQPGDLLVDVACGNGRLTELAAQRDVAAIGLDLSYAGIAEAARATPQAGWVVSDGIQIPIPDACADFVTCIGSLEHYDRPTAGVAEIARILKPMGRACILLPNAFGLLGNIRHVAATGEVFDDLQPLQRYATRATWDAMLTHGGLTIERLVPWGEVNYPRTDVDRRWMLRRPQKALRAGLAAITPVNLANHFVYICRPAAAPEASYSPTLTVR